MKKIILATALFGAATAPAFAALDGAKLYQEKTCVACHGPTGTKPLMPDYPKIAGQNKAYVEKQMLDIKNGVRTNGNSAAMKGVMEIVSEEEIKAIAEHVSKLKP